jgi:hypothetical protein
MGHEFLNFRHLVLNCRLRKRSAPRVERRMSRLLCLGFIASQGAAAAADLIRDPSDLAKQSARHRSRIRRPRPVSLGRHAGEGAITGLPEVGDLGYILRRPRRQAGLREAVDSDADDPKARRTPPSGFLRRDTKGFNS